MSMRPHETCKPWRKTIRGEKRKRDRARTPGMDHLPLTLRVVADEFGHTRLARIQPERRAA